MNKFGLTNENFNLLQKVFSNNPEINNVLLFGSRAKGNYNNRSDIDLVITNDLPNRYVIGKILDEVNNSNFPYLIDLQVLSNITNQNLLEHIKRVGLVFYNKERTQQ